MPICLQPNGVENTIQNHFEFQWFTVTFGIHVKVCAIKIENVQKLKQYKRRASNNNLFHSIEWNYAHDKLWMC